MTERRLGFAWYFFGLFAVAFCSIALDLYVKLDDCDYDSCRYLRFSVSDAGLDEGLLYFGEGTKAMHQLYGDVGVPFKFLYAGLLNFLILSAALIFARVRPGFVFLPLAFTFIVLPGKEFFVVAALLVFFSSHSSDKSGAGFSRLVCALLFLLFARPSFLPVLLFAYYLWQLVSSRQWYLVVLICFVLSSVLGFFVGIVSPPDPDHSALQIESSIESISIIRNITFGFEVHNIWIRSAIYFSYLIFLPFLEVYRFYSDLSADVNSPAQFYAIGAVATFVIYFLSLGWGRYWRLCCVSAFVISSTYPFLHTRYLLPVTLMIYFSIVLADQKSKGASDYSWC